MPGVWDGFYMDIIVDRHTHTLSRRVEGFTCSPLDGRIMVSFNFYLLIYLFSFFNHLYELIM